MRNGPWKDKETRKIVELYKFGKLSRASAENLLNDLGYTSQRTKELLGNAAS